MNAATSARIVIDEERVIDRISPFLFGGFIEHMGRCVYQRITHIYQVSGADPKAANSFDHPDVVCTRELPGAPVVDGRFSLNAPPLSLTVAVVEAS
ncbi:MAG: hypothetical protein RMJ55_07150 [Roseiflexaceae bacterium]|nr:hypothetical protein [Roseiflexaceae bacterium]